MPAARNSTIERVPSRARQPINVSNAAANNSGHAENPHHFLPGSLSAPLPLQVNKASVLCIVFALHRPLYFLLAGCRSHARTPPRFSQVLTPWIRLATLSRSR